MVLAFASLSVFSPLISVVITQTGDRLLNLCTSATKTILLLQPENVKQVVLGSPFICCCDVISSHVNFGVVTC